MQMGTFYTVPFFKAGGRTRQLLRQETDDHDDVYHSPPLGCNHTGRFVISFMHLQGERASLTMGFKYMPLLSLYDTTY